MGFIFPIRIAIPTAWAEVSYAMAKPEPIAAVTGPEAKDLAETLKRPHVDPVAKRLYTGAEEEYRRTESRAQSKRTASD